MPLPSYLPPAGMNGLVPAPPALVVAAKPTQAIPFEEMRLPNGLRVILAQDASAPVVAVTVTYNVGSRDERQGRTGFAHLFEHMMFQGSENVGKGEHILLINSVGGSFNGTTNQDRTNYFETVPKNQLKLALFLEADRMRSLDVSQANLDNQRSVVQEEKRQSYDNRAYGQSQETLLNMAYTNFAYQHTTIGSMADLDAATLDDVKKFFATYYAPNNAVLCVVGDFDVNATKELVKQYFSPIPSKPAPPPVNGDEPTRFKAGERRKTISDGLARQTRYTQAYVTVAGNDKDYYPLRLLGDILAGGRSTRLYKALVETNKAVNVGAGVSESRGPSLFTINATLPPRVEDTAPIEEMIDAEIARIAKDGVTQAELDKAVTGARVSWANQYRTSLSRASVLSLYAVYFNNPNRVNEIPEQLSKVTTKQIQEVAKQYLIKPNRSILTIQPAARRTAASGATKEGTGK